VEEALRHCAEPRLLGVVGSVRRDPELKGLPPASSFLSCRKALSLVISKHHRIPWERRSTRDVAWYT